MKRAALGFRMHSGWGVLVAVDDAQQIVERRQIKVIRDDVDGGKQPYHHAEKLGLPAAEKYLDRYLSESNIVAHDVILNVVSELQGRGYHIVGVAVLQASSRTLPPLPQILAAHPLIHTAEGKLFRDVIAHACELSAIPCMGIPERELEDRARQSLLGEGSKIIRAIAAAGRSLGPPWNADHKRAALAACITLHSQKESNTKGKALHG